MSAPTRKTIRDLDVKTDVVTEQAKTLRLDRGRLDEQRHQYLDLDPDSTCRPQGFVCVTCPPKEVRP